jgi:putative hydrolase of the HAD superfamily
MSRRFKAVFFDLGNTLLYFNGAWPQVFAQADRALLAELQAAGLDLDAEDFLREFRARLTAYFEEREAEFIEHTTAYVLMNLLAELGYPDVSEENVRPALERMYAVSQTHWHPEDDLIPTLDRLRQEGYRMGVISNASDDADVQTLVDQGGIRPYIEIALSSAACGVRKPNPRIFQIALEQCGLQAGETVMVGDTLGADILGARNAGLFSIWITRRADTPANRDHADTIRPDASIARLAELPALLAALD